MVDDDRLIVIASRTRLFAATAVMTIAVCAAGWLVFGWAGSFPALLRYGLVAMFAILVAAYPFFLWRLARPQVCVVASDRGIAAPAWNGVELPWSEFARSEVRTELGGVVLRLYPRDLQRWIETRPRAQRALYRKFPEVTFTEIDLIAVDRDQRERLRRYVERQIAAHAPDAAS